MDPNWLGHRVQFAGRLDPKVCLFGTVIVGLTSNVVGNLLG
jgi:hypothetical protein